MEVYFRRITVIRTKKPEQTSVNVNLQWLGNSLGLFSLRDKDRSCFRIFIELLKSAQRGESLSSDELAYRLNLTRGTIIHHIHTLEDKGIVVQRDGRYALRVKKLAELIENVRSEFLNSCNVLLDVAKDIDKKLVREIEKE
ncbi:helix-turn-helix transcriptional regulator [Candidatus Woesearchaeota archaeon]|nr:helix-turn-helix transcriptional regulator [Candidatus Woesearchaeota archaeon]